MLLLGGFAVLIGWFVGVALLWTSGTWRRRDKLLGTFVVPGGLLPVALLFLLPGSTTFCSGGSTGGHLLPQRCVTTGFTLPPAVSIPVALVLAIAPIVTAVHLELVRQRSSSPSLRSR